MNLRPSPKPQAPGPALRAFALCFIAAVAFPACASAPAAPAGAPSPSADSSSGGANTSSAPAAPAPPPLLRGARCKDTACTCRKPGDDGEVEPPDAGMKRLEVRLSFLGGEGTLTSPSLGFMRGQNVAETCYYVDVPGGSTSAVRFEGRAHDEVAGFTPRLAIAEYGAEGPYWYEVLKVECVGVGGRCDKAGSDAWVASLRGRKRGRIDPCGSLVVTNLKWDTSGSLAHRDNGFYRDFQVSFDLEAKKFTPKFAPHSTECVPK